MSVLIKAVSISPNELNVGESFSIQVHAEEATWTTLKTDLESWDDVKDSFTSWTKVKDFIIRK